MDTDIISMDTANYEALAEAMGIPQEAATPTSRSDAICRLRIWHRSVMGAVETGGKTRQMEVVPGGTYRFDDGSGEFKYCEEINFRPFLQRYRYNRWMPYAAPDSYGRKGKYIKSVFTHDYKVFNNTDIIDETGGFNCGRPSGYIKDWKDVPEKTRKLISAVKRVRAIFGTVSFTSYLTETGEVVETEGEAIPIIWEIENNDAFKIMGNALAKYRETGRLFPQHDISLTTDGSPMTNGNMLYQPVPVVNITKEIKLEQPKDSETLIYFQNWVNGYNKFIKESYDQKASLPPFAAEEAKVVDSFIDVE
jgi:hypothetical protein